MKYFFAFFISLLLLTACDDGDIIEPTFDFSSATVQKCSSSNTLYKISGAEALILTTPQTTFPNEEGVRTIAVSSATTIVYKKYSSTTNTANVCDTPTLSVLKEWPVSGGNLEITTTKIVDTNDPNKIIAYNHSIVFKNITFVAPDQQIVYDSYAFGNYRTEVIDLKFDYAAATTQTCPSNNLIFKYNNTNALLLDVNATLFNHTLGEKKQIIDANNKIVYRVYNGNLNVNFFCSTIPPSSPTLTEEWVAQNGVTDISGIIKVETTQESPTTYKHVIKLYNTTFKKGTDSYNPAPNADYTFGELITN